MDLARSGVSLVTALALGVFAAPALAVPAANEGPAVQVSSASPIAACLGDQPDSGVNFPDSELEPWMAVNHSDGADNDGISGDNLVAG